jgi:hypothetical protein
MVLFGLLVQWDDTCLASRKSRFESVAVHLRKVAGYGWPGRSAKAVFPEGKLGFDPLTFRSFARVVK